MCKKIVANAAAKKAIIFLSVFILAGIAMGNQGANQFDSIYLTTAGGKMKPALVSADPIMDIADHRSTLEVKEGQVEALIRPMSSEGDEVDTNRKEESRSVAEILESQRENDESFFSDEQDRVESRYGADSSKRSPTNQEFICLTDLPLSEDLQRYTYNLCIQQGLDYDMVLALMWRESRFDINAVNVNTNGTRDSGIMQINDVNRGWLLELGYDDLFDPYQNIAAGITLLSRLNNKYGTHNALMAYQYGEVGMQNKLNQGITTSRQLQVLYNQQEYYRNLLDEAA